MTDNSETSQYSLICLTYEQETINELSNCHKECGLNDYCQLCQRIVALYLRIYKLSHINEITNETITFLEMYYMFIFNIIFSLL